MILIKTDSSSPEGIILSNVSPLRALGFPQTIFDYWRPGEIVEVNNYYPFGLLHQYSATTQNAYQYKYNGKELQETGMYDYGARMYMPNLGRWDVIDPLAESYRRWSPYHYAMNNPANLTDPDGMGSYDSEGNWKSEMEDFYNYHHMDSSYRPKSFKTDGLGEANGGGGSLTVVDLLGALLSSSGSSPSFQFPEGQEAYYKKNYPFFFDFVKNQLPNMVADSKFMKALSAASGFSMDELTESFKYGQGMYLKGMDLTLGDAEYLYGGITESSTRNTTAIDTPVLDWFEKANRNPQSVEGLTNLMYMSALIAHETGHWGDDVKRTVKYDSTGLSTQYGDVGNFFEHRAFGGRMGSYKNGISGSIKNYVQTNLILLQSIFK